MRLLDFYSCQLLSLIANVSVIDRILHLIAAVDDFLQMCDTVILFSTLNLF